ncbi:alginate O-acetyltransferase AlgF [Pseudomonas syringae]|nr:alginate O-acetyltransferase AlgF [Pseudomonas syringae]
MYARISLWLGLGLASTLAQAAGIAQLYAPKLPEGSAWLRVVNPADDIQQVRVGDSAAQALSARAMIASPFQAVDARRPLPVTVNGRELKDLKAPANAFVTLILDRDPATAPRLVIDPPPRGKDLKAELNVYNLGNGCAQADIKLANNGTVFSQIAFNGQAQRTINPVQATLIGHCGQAASLPLQLEPFQAGDRYSLFLVGSAQHPRLVGLVDKTAP